MEFVPKNPDFAARIRQQLTRQHFMHHIGFDLHTIRAGYTEGHLELAVIHHQQDGFAHGGVVATLADIVAGFAACTLVGAGQNVVTGELKISYLRKGLGQRLRACGRVIKAGSRVMFCEADVLATDGEKETLIARATTSMIVC